MNIINRLRGRRELMDKLVRAEEILNNIELPGYGVGLVESGLVERLRISRDGRVLGVYINFRGYTQECLYCSTISEWALYNALRKARERLIAELGLEEVVFIDTVLNRLVSLDTRIYRL